MNRRPIRLARCLAFALVSLAAAAPLSAQVVRGRVMDAGTGAPVARATVRLMAADSVRAQAVTDTAGSFVLQAPRPGPYRVTAERLGYAAARSGELALGAGAVIDVVYRMSADAVALEPLAVVSRRWLPPGLAGFERRAARRHPGAVFMRRDEILRRSPSRAADVFYGVHGLRVRSVMINQGHQLPQIVSSMQCEPDVFIDGTRQSGGAFLNDFISSSDMEAVEVYRTSIDAPIEYRTARGCAVILIWTRTGTDDSRTPTDIR